MIKHSPLFKEFTASERLAGLVLIFATLLTLLLSNLLPQHLYNNIFQSKLGFNSNTVHLKLSAEHWINDGLMTIFFLLAGLEIERELYIGEISSFKNASLPLAAALGGMLFPFAIHFVLNYHTPTQHGSGIPMATDIAFALGILSMSKRVPYGLKVFLTAFAIIDDLGAIIIIAIFYTRSLSIHYLLIALAMYAVMIVLNRLKVYKIWPYIFLGCIMWYCMLQSGVHATVSGVLLAFALPFGDGGKTSPSYIVQHWLHKPVAFIILPLFAVANMGIPVDRTSLTGLQNVNSLGIILGLLLGKPLGILLLSYASVKMGWSSLPTGVRWKHVFGAATLGGIGFTMSIFITMLAFDEGTLISQSKIAILVASTLASVTGLFILRRRVTTKLKIS